MANEKLISAEALLLSFRDDPEINGKNFARVKRHIENAPAVDAVVLPCEVGALVYFHHIEGVKEDGSLIVKVRTGQVYQICIEANNEIWIRVSFGIWYCCRRYTDFYFSKEEAEAALAKMDGDGNGVTKD